jgi:HK97 family phage major capsid protein
MPTITDATPDPAWVTQVTTRSWRKPALSAEIQKRMDRIAAIRAGNGDTLVGLAGDPAKEVKRLMSEAQILGEQRARMRSGALYQHPGHGDSPGSRRGGHDDPLGVLRGLGQAWLDNLGGGDPTKLQAALDGTSGGTMSPAFFDPGLRDLPQRAVFVRALIPTVKATGDKYDYVKQTVATQNAAPVAVGGIKPTSVYTLARVEDSIRTIAHVTEALDRMLLSDMTALTQFLDNQLRLGVLQAEESQILSGSGTAPQLRGILNTSGIQTQARSTDPQSDAIYKAIIKVRLQFMEPTGIVLHPSDWQTIRLSKASTSGDYLAGDIIQSDPERLWGYPVVASPVMTAGTALVGDFGQATVYDREQARVTFTEAGLSDVAGTELFLQNQIRFRAESRIGLAVVRPAAFCTVTGM